MADISAHTPAKDSLIVAKKRINESARKQKIDRSFLKILFGVTAVVLAVSLFPLTPPAASAAIPSKLKHISSLSPGQSMSIGTAMISPDKKHYATVETNGNFVIRASSNNAAVWQTKTAGIGSKTALWLHAQGEIMLYQSTTGALNWQAGTNGVGPGTKLELRNGGVLALMSPGRVALWTSKSGITGAKRTELTRGSSIGAGQSLVSLNGKFRAGIMANGAFGIWGSDGKVKWSVGSAIPLKTTSAASKNSTLSLGKDSEVTLKAGNGVVKWKAGTQWGDVLSLKLSEDGKIAAKGKDNSSLWASNTGRTWSGKGKYTGGTAAYQTKVRTLMTKLGCGAVDVTMAPINGGVAHVSVNRVTLQNNMPAWSFAYVVTHECAHMKQWRAAGSNYHGWSTMEKKLAQIYGVKGSMGIEMSADCMSGLTGNNYGHYTKSCSGARLTAAKAMAAGRMP